MDKKNEIAKTMIVDNNPIDKYLSPLSHFIILKRIAIIANANTIPETIDNIRF